MTSSGPKLSHVEINVADYAASIRFYDRILFPLGWERYVCRTDHTVYCDGFLKLILIPVSADFKDHGFHRRRIGLNHIAFSADSKEAVDRYYRDIMIPNGIQPLYHDGPSGDEEYCSVFFEDPDRMKIEVVSAPRYCEKGRWPNNLESNFNPYQGDAGRSR